MTVFILFRRPILKIFVMDSDWKQTLFIYFKQTNHRIGAANIFAVKATHLHICIKNQDCTRQSTCYAQTAGGTSENNNIKISFM